MESLPFNGKLLVGDATTAVKSYSIKYQRSDIRHPPISEIRHLRSDIKSKIQTSKNQRSEIMESLPFHGKLLVGDATTAVQKVNNQISEI